MNRAKEAPNPQYKTPNPKGDPMRWSCLATFTKEIMKEWKGIIIGAMSKMNMTQLYRVLVLDNLNPASELTKTTPETPTAVASKVLRKYLGYSMMRNALRKFSNSNDEGRAKTFVVISENVLNELITTKNKG